MLRHFERIAGASAELGITFEGLEVADVTPERVPALASGEYVTFLARITAGTEGRERLDELCVAAATVNHPDAERILATLLALALADRLSRRERSPLEPMLMKARAWLVVHTRGVDAPPEGWKEWAGKLI